MPKFCVIGAGITGLAKAWRLHQEGHEVTVLESSAKVGGAMCSYRQDGYLCEEGPNSIQINSHAVEAFFQSIPGLKEAMIEAQPEAKKRFIVRDGQLHALPTSPLAVISSPIWSLRGKLSALKEPFVKAAPSDSEQSVADFVRRRLGEELYKYAINPLIGGIYAGNPEKLSLRYAFPRLHELEQMHGGLIRGAIAKKKGAKKGDEPKVRKRIVTFKEGIDTLPRLIAAALGTQVHTRTTISSIRQKDEQWQVSWKSEASRSELFDQLILTVPAYALGKLPFGDSLAQRLSSLSTIHYPPVSVLSLGYRREQVKHPLDGFGALVPECEQRKILGVLFPNSVFEGRAPKGSVLLTVFVGGTRNLDLATEDTDALKGIVASDLKALLGINSAPEFTHHRHWPTAIPQYNIGYGEVLKNIGQIETDYKGLSLLGNYRTGISLTDCIKATQSHSLGALD